MHNVSTAERVVYNFLHSDANSETISRETMHAQLIAHALDVDDSDVNVTFLDVATASVSVDHNASQTVREYAMHITHNDDDTQRATLTRENMSTNEARMIARAYHVTLTRKASTNEFLVALDEERDDEARRYYTDDVLDAIATARAKRREATLTKIAQHQRASFAITDVATLQALAIAIRQNNASSISDAHALCITRRVMLDQFSTDYIDSLIATLDVQKIRDEREARELRERRSEVHNESHDSKLRLSSSMHVIDIETNDEPDADELRDDSATHARRFVSEHRALSIMLDDDVIAMMRDHPNSVCGSLCIALVNAASALLALCDETETRVAIRQHVARQCAIVVNG